MQGSLQSVDSSSHFAMPPRAGACECESPNRPDTEAQWLEILAKGKALLRQKDDAIEYQALLRKESEHRFLNDMQLVVTMLSMQGRAASNAETAAQLLIVANRVRMIGRIHRLLHGFDGNQTVAFRKYVGEFCNEFSQMLSSTEGDKQVILGGGAEIELPAATAIPLAFIVSELLTNAAKYGKGQIQLRLDTLEQGYQLSVSNEGPGLPEGFDPAACKGLGMKIVLSFVQRIGGVLSFGPAAANGGAKFTVSFS